MTDDGRLASGLYDQPVTLGLARALAELEPSVRKEIDRYDPHHAPAALARSVHHRLVRALASLRGGNDDDRLEAQVTLANRVLELLGREAEHGGATAEDAFDSPARRLLALFEPEQGRVAQATAPPRPQIALASSDLLVNGPHDLSVGSEVRRELASADRVDLLCSFLKWSGLRLLREALRELLDRRPGGLRVLTTAYMGATERRALDELAHLGAHVKVSYDTGKTRLHARAWLFHRDTGFSTACIGSSNLSAAAMLDGLEWNVRLSQVDNGAILDKFQATFEQYWADPEFRSYEPGRDGDDYEAAIRREAGSALRLLPNIDVTPRPHQQEILDHLAAERARGHTRNLVVAATGTGKTVVAALDYRRLKSELGRATLLFVAHRREILDQSLMTFQVALRDGSFGETMHSGQVPRAGRHVFAAVQSLHADRLREVAPDAYDVVIVDEFHHAAAPTYDRLLAHLRPRVLLGLTATPERTDGRSVLGWFDGRIASELRLWKALDQGLLSPFQYFGLGGPDVSAVPWSRGRYDVSRLSNVYTADDLFVTRVLQEVHDKVTDPSAMRALGFCVDKAHARFMADRFRRAGIEALAVTSDTPDGERDEALRRFRDGSLRVLFSVDLFNEGVDLPDADTVIFLRPTESSTLFLQQLGRGLRRAEGKECLTVLDFIGGAHRKFRFDARFRAIVGGTRRSIERAVQSGFPRLPSGCAIHLDRVAQAAVLENIEHALGLGARGLVQDLRELGEVDLRTFLEEAGVELEDVYAASGRCWTVLRRAAGLDVPAPGPDDPQLERALARVLHVDDALRLDGFREFLRARAGPAADPGDPVQRYLFMLLGYVRVPLSRMADAWQALWASPAIREELLQLLDLLDDRLRTVSWPLEGELAPLPLRVHATYTLDEIMAGADERNREGGIKRIQTGVYQVKRHRADLLFITLEKSASEYSPTTLYNDYPLSDRRFHWETQSSCHADTPTGRRYIHTARGSGHHVLLFVRRQRRDDRGETMPYVFLGPGHHHTHRGARPMQIEWDLAYPMPAGLYQEVKIAAG